MEILYALLFLIAWIGFVYSIVKGTLNLRKKNKRKDGRIVAAVSFIFFIASYIVFTKTDNSNDVTSSSKLKNVHQATIVSQKGTTDLTWKITGKADAKNGTKVYAVDPKDDSYINLLENENGDIPRVKDGKFSGEVSSYASNVDDKIGSTEKVLFIATNNKIETSDELSIKSKIVKNYTKHFKPQKLVIDKTLHNAFNEPDDTNESSRSDISSSSTSKSSTNSRKGATSSNSRDSLTTKALKIYNDIGGDDVYPLFSHIKVNTNSDKDITGIMIWTDESLANGTKEDIQHYFSAGAQIGNRLLDNDKDGEYNVPFIEVFAGSRMVARSQYTNNAQMKVLH
ncbi:hypothetical protein [Pediococcus pentosaceus]|uniref:hypothetical protein n=1 Tax=Pediococcus pentosaceus TaxID=1255 RepID=UPI000C08B533|nr:hypothetical protein [Pediococcus pentosaceus]